MSDVHYHVYAASADGPVRGFVTRASDVFNTREAAQKWAAAQRPVGRRLVRRCPGGPLCPGTSWLLNGHHSTPRPGLPAPRPDSERRRSARLVRLRQRLDEMDAARLAELETWLNELD